MNTKVSLIKRKYFELYHECFFKSACDAADVSCGSCSINLKLTQIENEMREEYSEKCVEELKSKVESFCGYLKGDSFIK